MADDQMSLQQFGATVKAKYPAYASKSDEEIGKAMLAKYPQYQSRVKQDAPAPQKSFIDKLTEIQPPDSSKKWNPSEALKAVGNIGAGGLGVLLHPINTAVGIGESIVHPIETAKNLARQFKENPYGTVEAGVGQVGAMAGVGEVAGKGLDVARGRMANVGSAPRAVGELVKKTQAENTAATEKAAKKTAENETGYTKDVAEQQAKRKADVGKFFEKKTSVLGENAEKQGAVDRREALDRGVKQLDTKFHEDLLSTEKDVNAKANEKYSKLRAALKDDKSGMYQPKGEDGHIQGNPISVPQRLFDTADASMRGSDNAPTIIKDLGKRVSQGEVSLSYNDLQGYREEIGRELRKGTLAPDVFDAYKRMMPMIDEAMQEIAERKGMGGAQTEARNYYRQYAQTFLDKDSPLRQAINEGKSLKREPGSVINSLGGKDAAVQALARYNPELARRANTVRGHQTEAATLPKKVSVAKVIPKLSEKPAPIEKPPPVTSETKTIGAKDIEDTKQARRERGANQVRHWGKYLGFVWPAIETIRTVSRGEMPDIASTAASMIATPLAADGIARIIESPKMKWLLTHATPKDIAQVPADLRGDFPAIVQAAEKQGIGISPAMKAAIAAGVAAPQKRVGDILSKTQ